MLRFQMLGFIMKGRKSVNEIEASPITLGDIDYIMNNLWDISQMEIVEFGFTKETATEWIMKKSQGYSFCVRVDGVPTVLCGATIHPNKSATTWFIAAHWIQEIGFELIRFLRRELKSRAKKENVSFIESLTASVDNRAEKFFRLLGFERDRKYYDEPNISRYMLTL